MKKLMLGNQAVARGLYEASCAFVSSYPGTPSTEITEYAAKYPGMKKLQWRRQSVQVFQAYALSAQ